MRGRESRLTGWSLKSVAYPGRAKGQDLSFEGGALGYVHLRLSQGYLTANEEVS